MIIWRRILWPTPSPKVSTGQRHLGTKTIPLASKSPVVFSAGDAVLSESEPYLGDWKTRFDLAFPIGGTAWLAVLIVISLFSKDLSLVKTNVHVGKDFLNLLIKVGAMLPRR